MKPLDSVAKHGDHSDPDHDLGIGRRDMPQVDLPSLRALLSRRGVRAQRRRMNPSDLRRTQDGLNPEKVQEIARGAKPLGVIVVSRDGHILDGHHRWAAAMERGIKVDSLVVDLGIEDLLALVESGDVEKAAVIRFAPGLRPNLDTRRGIIKHLQGKHDQSDHGRRGSGGTREALTARAEQLESEGRGAAAAVYRLRLHTDGPGGVRAFTRRESDSASLPVRDGQRQQVATLAVHELSPEARGILRAGGISTPVVHELDAENGGAEFFHAAISRSKEGNPYASSVFVYEPSEYRGMRLFVSEDGQSGIALKGDEIVSLFKTGTSGDREVSRPLLELGIQEGGRRGDCFDTVLPKIYAEHGLEVRHRVAWNDEYAPEGWDKRLYKKWNNGEPDVTFFRYNRDYTDEYRPGQGSLVDSYDDAVALTQAAVLKHLKGQHDQSTHGGGGGGFREVEAANNDQAWAAVLTDEARMIDDRMRAFPERYNPRGPGYGLKDGQTETRVVRQGGPPRVRDYQTSSSAGLSIMEAIEVDGSLTMAESGYGKPLLPVGAARPPKHVYRVMSEGEWQQAKQRGYIKSDERMNLSSDEGTVTSLRSTGAFYVPVDGSDYRVVRIKYADEDGWRTDPIDGYIKTDARIPFDRVDMATTPISQAPVSKHLKGQHDQKTHGGDGAAALPSGWTEYEAIEVDEMQPDGTFVTHPRRTFGGPNQTVVTVTGTDIPASRVNQILTDVTTLQGIAPVENLKVDVGEGPFAQQGLSDTVYGFVPVGQSRIFLRPAARPFVDPGFNMPVLADDPGRYTLVHEYGHVLDRRSAEKAAEDKSIVIASHQTGMSRYAFAEEPVQPGREAFAEAFVGWVGSQGTFASDGPSGKAFVKYFANKYGWDSGGPGRPPSAGFAKQASGGSGLLIADTFSAEGPKQVMPRSPVAKHGDPSRPGYGQLHPNSGTGRYADWGDHAGRIAEAASRGPDSEGLSFIAAGETYYTEEEALAAFKEVYDYRHEGTNRRGEKVVLQSEVISVTTSEGEGTYVEGVVKDDRGRVVGNFERVFSVDSDGVPVVDHALLELSETAQGAGFATEFNARAEDYYVSHGVDRITLHAALDKGGYAWASAGYEFDTRRSKLTYTRESLAARLKDADSFVPGIGNVEELRDLGRRLMLSPDSAEFPTPFEISRVGYTDGAETWPGKQILLGSDWYGEKVLRAEGRTAKSVAVRVLKHGDPSRPGYAQLHPTGAGSKFAEWGDHAGRIAAAEGRGPSEDVLLRAIEGGSLTMPSEDEIAEWIQQNRPDDIDMTIENNNNLYQRKEEIEGTEYERDWERDDAIQELRREAAYLLAAENAPYYAEAMGRGPYYDEDEARAAFGEVYDYEHSGVNKDGDPVTIFATVAWVEAFNDQVKVVGDLKDDQGRPIGLFERRFFKDDDGRLMVEHEMLKMDPEFQGAGFATEFNARAEDYYVSHGIAAIRVHAGLDQGGYTWASAGFDFDPRPWELARSVGNITDRMDNLFGVTSPGRASLSPAQREQFTSIMVRLVSKGRSSKDFPTPFEISRFGWTEGAETWPGREIMTGSNWYGEKPLTPAGRRRSATEAANKSAVFRLAPGLRPVLKHLKGKHDQQTHAGGGGGYEAGGEAFQRDQESWFNAMLEERQGGDSPLLTEGQMRLPVDQRLKAAVAARLAERMSDVPAEKMAEAAFVGARPAYEHPHMAASREAMQPGSWVAIRDPLVYTAQVGGVGDLMVKPDDGQAPGDGWVRSGTPEAAAKVRQAAASRMVQMWASSSNDDNIVSLAVQDAAAAEFGMEGHAPWPARGDVGRVARERAEAMTASHGDVYRSFVRAQYDETQTMFSELGVGSVRVFRGFRVEDAAMSDAFQMYETGFMGKARLRPLSAWSTRPEEAVSFAEGANSLTDPIGTGVVLSARLPVSQILSTPYTGVGCLGEDEVVSVTPTVEAAINIVGKVG